MSVIEYSVSGNRLDDNAINYRFPIVQLPDCLAENLFGDGLQLQVGRAFVDLADLGVAVQLLDRIVLHEAVAAEQVDGERRRRARRLPTRKSCTSRPR